MSNMIVGWIQRPGGKLEMVRKHLIILLSYRGNTIRIYALRKNGEIWKINCHTHHRMQQRYVHILKEINVSMDCQEKPL